MITTQDKTDLDHLHNFVLSIESAPAVSDAAAKLLQLFQTLYSVAIRYMETYASFSAADQAKASVEPDAYMAQLSLPAAFAHRQPPPTELDQGQRDTSGLGTQNSDVIDGADSWRELDHKVTGNTTQSQDWLNSNSQMMELIGELGFTLK